MDVLKQIQTLDIDTLTPIVRRALRSETAELVAWDSRPLDPAAPIASITTGGVYRVFGQAMDGGVACSWSLIVKVLKSPAGVVVPGGITITQELADDASRFAYWRREANAFASGRLDELGGPLVAPRCFGITAGPSALPGRPERPAQRVWLWLEELEGSAPAEQDYALIGRHLGMFNGRSFGAVPIVAEPWMSRRWLRSWLETALAQNVSVLESNDLWAHPMLRRAFPQPLQHRLLRLWTERESLLSVLERQPQAFCHLDAYLGNLFLREHAGEQQTVAIDWAFAGMAAPGEELSALVVGTALVGFGDVATIKRAEQRAMDGYLAGLDAAGWKGDPRCVRLAYLASAALRYGFLGTELPLRALLEPGYRNEAVRRLGRPWERLVEQRAALTYLLLDYADQAFEQLGAG